MAFGGRPSTYPCGSGPGSPGSAIDLITSDPARRIPGPARGITAGSFGLVANTVPSGMPAARHRRVVRPRLADTIRDQRVPPGRRGQVNRDLAVLDPAAVPCIAAGPRPCPAFFRSRSSTTSTALRRPGARRRNAQVITNPSCIPPRPAAGAGSIRCGIPRMPAIDSMFCAAGPQQPRTNAPMPRLHPDEPAAIRPISSSSISAKDRVYAVPCGHRQGSLESSQPGYQAWHVISSTPPARSNLRLEY